MEGGKKQDVMTLSDSDDVQTISSGSDDNKDKKPAPSKMREESLCRLLSVTHHTALPAPSVTILNGFAAMLKSC